MPPYEQRLDGGLAAVLAAGGFAAPVTQCRGLISYTCSVLTMEATLVSMGATEAKIIGPHDGMTGFLGSIGVRFMIDGLKAGQRFSLFEHPMSARVLAAPLHWHSREDECSFVLEGQVGALLGDEVVIGKPGDLIFKPRDQWHTFWNAGDEPARILEIISPAGFEEFFRELVNLGGVTQAEPHTLSSLCERYILELRPDTVPELLERFGLRLPGQPLT